MGRKNTNPAAIKEQVVKEYLNSIKGTTEISQKQSINLGTLRRWVKKHRFSVLEQ